MGVEQKLKASIEPGLDIAATVDFIIKHTKGPLAGQIMPYDHKFTNNFWSPEMALVNTQVSKYIWVLQQNNIDTNSGALNQIRYRKMDRVKNEVFRRTPITPSDTRLKNLVEEFAKTAREIASIKSGPNVADYQPRKVLNANCEYCSFLTMCNAQLDGESTEIIEKVKFVTNDPYLSTYKELEVDVTTG